jgi:predicted amidophosphoribosyltransferase
VIEQPVVEEPTGSVPEGIVICPGCGAENVPGEIFCDVCGEPLETPEPVEVEIEIEEAFVEPAEAATIVDEEVVEFVEVEEVVVDEAVAEAVEAEEVAVEDAVVDAAEGVYCSVCGSEVSAGDTFCGNCGAALGDTEGEEVPIIEEPLVETVVAEEPAGETPVVEAPAVETMVVEEPAGEMPVVEETVAEAPVVAEVVVEEVVAEDTVIADAVAEVEAAAEALAVTEVEAVTNVGTVADVVQEDVVAEDLHCSVCGAVVMADQAFCASCGAALQTVEEGVPVEPEVIATGPYLEVVASGAHIPLVEQPESLVGRLDEVSGIEPEVDMTPHGGLDGGVSRRHAKLLYEGNAWYVMDLDSTNGTLLNGTELAPRTRAAINDGDKIEFGEVEVVFYNG